MKKMLEILKGSLNVKGKTEVFLARASTGFQSKNNALYSGKGDPARLKDQLYF